MYDDTLDVRGTLSVLVRGKQNEDLTTLVVACGYNQRTNEFGYFICTEYAPSLDDATQRVRPTYGKLILFSPKTDEKVYESVLETFKRLQ